MLDAGRALSRVSTDDLILLLRALVREEIHAPVTALELARIGALRLLDEIGFLRGMTGDATRAVLIAVIAERRHGRPS